MEEKSTSENGQYLNSNISSINVLKGFHFHRLVWIIRSGTLLHLASATLSIQMYRHSWKIAWRITQLIWHSGFFKFLSLHENHKKTNKKKKIKNKNVLIYYII